MLSQIDLTAALRPLLLSDETLLFVQNAVGLYEGYIRLILQFHSFTYDVVDESSYWCRKYKIPNYQNGCAYLTSHRACYVDNDDPRKYSVAVDLKDIDRIEFYAGFLKSSPKITLHLKSSSSSGSPGGPSASSTPRNGTPLIRPTSPLPVSTGVWICPICSFSNPVPSNYIPQVTTGSIPPCLACGIRPPTSVLDNSFQQPPRSPTPLSSLPTLYPNSSGGGSSVPSSNTLLASTLQDGSNSGEATFACPRCTFLNHPSLNSCEICGERLVSPNLPTDIPRVDSPAPISSTRKGGLVGETVDIVKFSFRAGGEKTFHEKLKGALVQRKWLLQNAPPVPIPGQGNESGRNAGGGSTTSTGTNGGTERVVGIAGLERQGMNVRKKNQVVIEGAFEDLEALMGRAKEMVALAESFAVRLASTPTFTNGEAKAALANSTQALGLVTRDMLGGGGSDKASELYLSELARQVAEFLADDTRSILKKEGGVITLVDLWAVYNRARGIELISPSDLEKAARLFEKLKLPVRLRKFKSGLLVVQEARSTDTETVRRILEWIENDVGSEWGRGVTASEAAEKFSWSVGVASEELEMAEEKGALCREVGVEGVRFWKNWFIHEIRVVASGESMQV